MNINKIKCLIIDDEEAICATLSFHFKDNNIEPYIATSAMDGLKILDDRQIDVIITDFQMKEMNGLELLGKIKEKNEDIPVIIITGYGTVELAVEALKNGAFDFVSKPVQVEKLITIVNNAAEKLKLKLENTLLKHQLADKIKSEQEFIGASEQIKNIKKIIEDAAPTNASILITGESGVGKEIIAKEIFMRSSRNGKPFHALNCTSIPANLVESELFGYNKGAFTGAYENKKGIIELIRGGTLFLDEIGDLPFESQGKLLRLLENKEFYRLGGTAKIEADFRLISATNKNLKKLIAENKFREDLYYRISVVEINAPALRYRKNDIIPLAEFFISQFSKEMKKEIPLLSESLKKRLIEFDYPGNIRELKNIIERMIIFNKDKKILNDFGSAEVINGFANQVLSADSGNSSAPTGFQFSQVSSNPDEAPALKEIEKKYIEHILNSVNFNKDKAAKILKIARKTLWLKIKSYNIYNII
ncbi:MAG TPA: sigma-54 dependent transcriptional regulator [bacterium]|nr:sigma-54 dependent transcriptional regulator [bacterium]HPN30654.1 sigma-54 dependent transcriptional regulator [bacterium]